LFNPDGLTLADPSEVESALAALWKPSPGQPDAEVATRICTGNLIVVGSSTDWPRLSGTLGELSPLVPSQTVVWLFEELYHRHHQGAAEIRASVSALCHLPQPGRPQVCAEQIVLRASAVEPDDMVRTLLPLLEADVPTMTWWTIDPVDRLDLLAGLRSQSDRLVLEAGAAGLAHLESVGGCAVRELGWYYSYPWREQIAGLFDGPAAAALGGIKDVVIEMAGGDEHRVDAIWLAAFLAGQLGWQPEYREQDRYAFRSAGRSIPVTLHCRPISPAGLVSLIIGCADAHFEIVRCADTAGQYRVIECDARICEMPRCIEAKRLGEAEALAMSLSGRVTDPAFTRAAPIAAWMAAAAA
jgi:hypothetical protein